MFFIDEFLCKIIYKILTQKKNHQEINIEEFEKNIFLLNILCGPKRESEFFL